jgi:hypothetical protein
VGIVDYLRRTIIAATVVVDDAVSQTLCGIQRVFDAVLIINANANELHLLALMEPMQSSSHASSGRRVLS